MKLKVAGNSHCHIRLRHTADILLFQISRFSQISGSCTFVLLKAVVDISSFKRQNLGLLNTYKYSLICYDDGVMLTVKISMNVFHDLHMCLFRGLERRVSLRLAASMQNREKNLCTNTHTHKFPRMYKEIPV